MAIKQRNPKSPIPSPHPPDLDFERMHVAFCFRDIDPNQGGTLKDWEDLGLLPRLVYRLAAVSGQTIREAKQNQSIKSYHTFPIKMEAALAGSGYGIFSYFCALPIILSNLCTNV